MKKLYVLYVLCSLVDGAPSLGLCYWITTRATYTGLTGRGPYLIASCSSQEMTTVGRSSTPRKVCFVTVGATASFNSLIQATLSPAFLAVLKQYGYTDLRLQHGSEGGKVLEELHESQDADGPQENGLKISGFDFNKQGLGVEMKAAKGGNESAEGVVISHAGSSYHLIFVWVSI